MPTALLPRRRRTVARIGLDPGAGRRRPRGPVRGGRRPWRCRSGPYRTGHRVGGAGRPGRQLPRGQRQRRRLRHPLGQRQRPGRRRRVHRLAASRPRRPRGDQLGADHLGGRVRHQIPGADRHREPRRRGLLDNGGHRRRRQRWHRHHPAGRTGHRPLRAGADAATVLGLGLGPALVRLLSVLTGGARHLHRLGCDVRPLDDLRTGRRDRSDPGGAHRTGRDRRVRAYRQYRRHRRRRRRLHRARPEHLLRRGRHRGHRQPGHRRPRPAGRGDNGDRGTLGGRGRRHPRSAHQPHRHADPARRTTGLRRHPADSHVRGRHHRRPVLLGLGRRVHSGAEPGHGGRAGHRRWQPRTAGGHLGDAGRRLGRLQPGHRHRGGLVGIRRLLLRVPRHRRRQDAALRAQERRSQCGQRQPVRDLGGRRQHRLADRQDPVHRSATQGQSDVPGSVRPEPSRTDSPSPCPISAPATGPSTASSSTSTSHPCRTSRATSRSTRPRSGSSPGATRTAMSPSRSANSSATATPTTTCCPAVT